MAETSRHSVFRDGLPTAKGTSKTQKQASRGSPPLQQLLRRPAMSESMTDTKEIIGTVYSVEWLNEETMGPDDD